MQRPLQQLNVNVSEEDFVVCECNNETFFRAQPMLKIKPPIIGAPPQLLIVGDQGFCVCSACGKRLPTNVDEVKTRKDKLPPAVTVE